MLISDLKYQNNETKRSNVKGDRGKIVEEILPSFINIGFKWVEVVALSFELILSRFVSIKVWDIVKRPIVWTPDA